MSKRRETHELDWVKRCVGKSVPLEISLTINKATNERTTQDRDRNRSNDHGRSDLRHGEIAALGGHAFQLHMIRGFF